MGRALLLEGKRYPPPISLCFWYYWSCPMKDFAKIENSKRRVPPSPLKSISKIHQFKMNSTPMNGINASFDIMEKSSKRINRAKDAP